MCFVLGVIKWQIFFDYTDQTPIRCAVEAHRRLKLEEKEVLCTQVIAHLVSKGVDVLDRTGCMVRNVVQWASY